MKRLKRGDIVEIKANKWRDSYGNTYHNVQVYVNDDYVGQSGNTYGYGDHYMQTAREMIFDKYKAPYGYDTSNPIYMLKDKGVKVSELAVEDESPKSEAPAKKSTKKSDAKETATKE